MCEAVKDRVAEHARMGQFVVTLGGDHSLAIGTVSGIADAYSDSCLIWVDAHAVFIYVSNSRISIPQNPPLPAICMDAHCPLCLAWCKMSRHLNGLNPNLSRSSWST